MTQAVEQLIRNGVTGFSSRFWPREVVPSRTRLPAGDPAWKWLYATVAAALAVRIALALWSVRVNHPDEIFQYVEQAHRLVYGYGYVPWEYRFGTRNWLLPLVLAGILEVFRFAGMDRPSLYIPAMNCVFAVLSVSVVFSSYVIARKLFSEPAARVAAVLAAGWYELLYASSMATPEVLGCYAILGAFAIAMLRSKTYHAIWIGLLLGTAVALRPQYAIPAAAVWAYVVVGWPRRLIVPLTLSCLATPAIAGLLDYGFWGAPFISYFNYFRFELAYGPDAPWLFGKSPPLGYVLFLTYASLGLYPVALVYGVIDWRKSWPILLLIGCVLIPHSLIGHKEYRYVFLSIPLFVLLMAAIVVGGFPRLRHVALGWVCVVSLLGCTYRDVLTRDDHLLAYLDLSRRIDVKAVSDLTGQWWESGGLYYLHHDVPVYFRANLANVAKRDFHLSASHVIVSATDAEIPGFRVLSRHHDIAVLEQITPPAGYQPLAGATRQLKQAGIDGHFVPQVHAAF